MSMLTDEAIKIYTIKFINGVSYLYGKQVDCIKQTICENLEIEKNEQNFKAIEEGIEIYFNTLKQLNN